MLQPWRTGKVIRITEETPSTRRFWIQVPELESFDFKPGQFVTLDLPIAEKPNKRWRSYSIASWPDGTNVFELIIVLLEGGLGTNYLFNQVTEGSELTLRGPQGVFILPEPIEKDLFFICTGTGIAPFRAMAHHILNHNVPHKMIYLIFGCRKFGDALYGKELKELAREMPNFRYLPTYSREEPSNYDHLIRIGYVHQVYEEICKSANGSPAAFFLCGWKNMIDEAKQRITALGYDRKSIHQELYG
ncbi:MAG: FAD-dependent oxidoreductase [Chitinophagaceae bacterium]|nr:MAG: FAD-dependent oxidoreductase [Chitinophagaceae bacterium]